MASTDRVSLSDTGDKSDSPPPSRDAASDNDNFEDAVDTGSTRSLTKRPASTRKLAAPDSTSSREDQVPRRLSSSEQDQQNEHAIDLGTGGGIEPQKQDTEETLSRRGSSPMSKRLSTTSNLDNVNLDDDSVPLPDDSKPPSTEQPNKTRSIGNSITGALPTLPWTPSVGSPTKSPTLPAAAIVPLAPPLSQPAPPSRKLTSPFSWLSRNSSSKEKELPPAPTSRRNTASSIATLTSNPELMLSRLDEEKEGDHDPTEVVTRNNLKDRFKLLRMREEAGIVTPLVENDNSESVTSTGPGKHSLENEQLSPSSVPGPSDSLAPGTVSGVNAGPSAMLETSVDWDLWQSVVYEGPTAVARTSPEELNRAIATGIPSAIRGVIWQVLAQSKNDELEARYGELVVRGTDKEKQNLHNGDLVASSASSVQSDRSGGNAQSSPQTEKSQEAALKAQNLSTAERKKKEKDDTAVLQKLEKTIRRDLGARTSFSKYAAAAGLQEGLFGVCKAYALYDEQVGYTQGMNFLIMPLLFNMPEQEAFCLLVRLMNHYQLRDLFVQDMPGLHMRLYQFERLLEDHEPALYCHLHRRGISPHLYATQWFLTLFAYRFPLQLVLRIYDLILSEGLSAVLRFGIVLMQQNAAILLAISDMQQLTVHLKDKLFDVYIDKDPSQGSLLESGFFGSSSASVDKEVYRADQLVRDACEVKITAETLKSYTIEWEEKTKLEKDRETELQELRLANQSLAVKVRRLEERVEICDREQAALATELVKTKVENEEVKDENESLKGQVRELRVVIDKQPIEIEERWTLERDDLMKRNQKVHEENEKVEKDLIDLEEQLVQTKMRYAEINSQHETLNRKWLDLKRQFQ